MLKIRKEMPFTREEKNELYPSLQGNITQPSIGRGSFSTDTGKHPRWTTKVLFCFVFNGSRTLLPYEPIFIIH